MADYIADLHIHSRYSGGCSKNLTIKLLTHYGNLKGISILGTGDFTFEKWLSELKSELIFDEETGLYVYDHNNEKMYFVLQTEINLIIDEGKKGIKKIHQVVLAPNFEVVEQINDVLSKYGSLENDARPTLKVQAPEFVETLKNIHDSIEIIPAHIFTPWFGIFGSFSGYDDIMECYKDKTAEIHALETGLSADPLYIYAISKLDRFSIVSNSDLHSYYPHRIGREATVFEFEKLTYDGIIEALRTDNEHLKMTIEFRPEEGKYNYDGCRPDRHKNGEDIYYNPTEERRERCPICKRKLTRGVLSRVLDLADRPLGSLRPRRKPFRYLLPLTEVIAYTYKIKSSWSQKVLKTYFEIIKEYGSEYAIMLSQKIDFNKLEEKFGAELSHNIKLVREGKFYFDPPGHDGVYGVLKIGERENKEKIQMIKQRRVFQKHLTDF